MKSRTHLLAGMAFFGLIAGQPAIADPLGDGGQAYAAAEYAEAMANLRPLADQGNYEARVYMGLMFYHGRGVQQNDVQAFNWISSSTQGPDAAVGTKKKDASHTDAMIPNPTQDQIAGASVLASE